MFSRRQSRILAGGPARNEEVDPLLDLPVDQNVSLPSRKQSLYSAGSDHSARHSGRLLRGASRAVQGERILWLLQLAPQIRIS